MTKITSGVRKTRGASLLQLNLKWLIGTLFMAATLALVIGLAFFLREVRLATRLLQISPPELNK